MGRLVAVDQRQQDAGGKRSEDRLQPETVGECGESDHQHERSADADLCGGVLETPEDV
jgi:hypothetical protein